MADNTNVQAVRVSNEKIRPLADRFGVLYNFCKALQAEYVANNWAALFPTGDPTGEIVDGARVDGRMIITNGDINGMFAIVTSFLTYMEQSTNANRNQVLKVAVNPE